MEATGVYWEALAFWCAEQNICLSVVNPLQIKSFAKSRLQRNKSDNLDAELIARFGAMMKPKLWQMPDIKSDELQIIMHQRDAYVAMLTQERNRRHALKRRPHCPQNILTMSQEMIDSLASLIAKLEIDIKERLQATPKWKEATDLITSVVGVGIITAGIILSETNCFSGIDSPEQFVAYAGLAPVVFSSGTSVQRGAHISPLCCHRLRKALYLAAVSAIRSDKAPFRAFYQQLRGRGKPPKVALIAVAHKIARVIAAVMCSKTPFQSDYRSIIIPQAT
jgi:transposase